MKIKQTLQNPFVLVAQGFVVGTLIFLSTAPRDDNGASAADRVASAVEKIGA
ncbi:MAG TPA: hypothetical protein VF589_10985 [Allosphingosinicella sp.]|jgi:hypothetical protein